MSKFLFAVFLIFLSCQIKAIEVIDLYQYKILVSDKTRQSRLTASRDALFKVLIKVSGRIIDKSSPAFRKAIRNIPAYMLKYEYSDGANNQQFLVIKFEANKVNQLLESVGQPIWGNRRPLVALWLAVEDELQRELVTQDSFPQIEQLLSDKSTRRGLPLVIPLLDLEDRQIVSVTDVWANFSEPVNLASQRYNAERIVTARLYVNINNNTWQLDWRFSDESQFAVNELVGDKQQIVGQMIDDVADKLSIEYAVKALNFNNDGLFNITIVGINNFTKLELVKRRLLSLSVIDAVTLKVVKDNKFYMQLKLSGNELDLSKALHLDSAFIRLFDPLASEKENPKNEYRWVGLK
ncbi:DUF2066 domain-containing protein [Pseudoalteromonas denitrificans]|uniref:DUF2066 domain-containing protein n=1 Tax=Pseudoalteromonas denitrificans DSM 6059 TaxID=1123010 RepID=A0A1I1P371_9GAMM|nr:DUF2066 domain-containing protein [Pseudoalteromonas denitrificans]SFD01423.1 hypothetical protein SAMN02745724_03207 [Pseudoalteromonas denitrificans DSM 6059]